MLFLHVECMSQIEFRSLIQIEIGRKGNGNNKAQDAGRNAAKKITIHHFDMK